MRAPDFWDRKTGGLLPNLLRPLGCVMASVAALRQKRGKPVRVSVPVICVGNLVAGGAGKTPVAIDLAQRLKARGLSVHVLMRGYGGTEIGPVRVDPSVHTADQVGDEALLLVKRTPTWVSRDRVQGAQAAIADGAQVLVLDDGFQNPILHKDLSLLVVDGEYGFGNGRVMPAGPLRETIEAGLARADAIVLIGKDDADVWGRVQRSGMPELPVLRAKIVPTQTHDDLKDRRVFAFCGIGRPDKFFDTLTKLGARLTARRAFDDHHPYTDAELDAIVKDAKGDLILTTAKDFVRIRRHYQGHIRTLPVHLAWKDGAQIDTKIDTMLAQSLAARADG